MPLQFIQPHREDAEEQAAAVRAELLAGLLRDPPGVSPKFLYDPLGSRLFDAITELPEYYPTRVEASIFAQHAAEIAAAAGAGSTLIDLGAGNCAKAARLFDSLRPAQYVAVDISVDFLRQSLTILSMQHPSLPMIGLGQDFSVRLQLPDAVRAERRLFFYPGSSLGNFSPPEALSFLRSLRSQCRREGGLLIGLDLVKDKHVLDAAYDDALGVTAAFNLNMLRHLNDLLGTDFRVEDWKHAAFFDASHSRIEMHLEARRSLEIRLADGKRRFYPGERIHTENSYKYRIPQIEAMVREAGFDVPKIWTDARQWFAVCCATAG